MNFQPSHRDVFILGAGFSHGVSKEMPLITGLTELVLRKGAFERWKTIGNIEEIMTFLTVSLPWESDVDQFQKRADFFKMVDAIRLRINGAEDCLNLETIDSAILELIGHWHDKQQSIITLNYDTIVETELTRRYKVHASNYFPIPLANPQSRDGVGILGGDEVPTATIYKLHGSVNWYYSGSETFYGEDIFLGPRIGSPDSEKFLKYLYDKVPLIIPPALEKSTFFKNETIKSLWRHAGRALERAERLFVLGYSLPESDLLMRYFLKENLTNDQLKQIIVVDPNPAIVERFKSVVSESIEVIHFQTKDSNSLLAFARSYGGTSLSDLAGIKIDS